MTKYAEGTKVQVRDLRDDEIAVAEAIVLGHGMEGTRRVTLIREFWSRAEFWVPTACVELPGAARTRVVDRLAQAAVEGFGGGAS
jgi:hypothetical protein